jgi:hypothetical protein
MCLWGGSDAARKAELNVLRCLDAAKTGLAKEKEPAANGGGVLAKLSTSFAKATNRTASDLQAKAYQAAVQYSEAVAAANARQVKYLSVDLPAVFKGMQSLESGRLVFLRGLLVKYATLLKEHATPMKVGQSATKRGDTYELWRESRVKMYHLFICVGGCASTYVVVVV